MTDIKQFLDYSGLQQYDSLIKSLISQNDMDLLDMRLTKNNILEIYYKKNGLPRKMSLDVSSLITYAEWTPLN